MKRGSVGPIYNNALSMFVVLVKRNFTLCIDSGILLHKELDNFQVSILCRQMKRGFFGLIYNNALSMINVTSEGSYSAY